MLVCKYRKHNFRGIKKKWKWCTCTTLRYVLTFSSTASRLLLCFAFWLPFCVDNKLHFAFSFLLQSERTVWKYKVDCGWYEHFIFTVVCLWTSWTKDNTGG